MLLDRTENLEESVSPHDLLHTVNHAIYFLEHYDNITHLPNRHHFIEECQQFLEQNDNNTTSAILLINLWNFKNINDNFGQDIGDKILIAISVRLKELHFPIKSLGHISGGEFALLITVASLYPKNIEQINLLAWSIIHTIFIPLALPYPSHENFHIACNIGITLIDYDNLIDFSTYLRQADIALNKAKKSGQNTLIFFNLMMQKELNELLLIEHELYQAIEQSSFFLYYQPQVDTCGHLTGVEALCRWLHIENGFISPEIFIPIAEENGAIIPLGKWIIKEAFAQLATWYLFPELSNIKMSINISAKQFLDPFFIDYLDTLLRQYTFDCSNLCFELTESMLLENLIEIIAVMQQVKLRSISISLDDFGTGFSSLSNLKFLPIDELKIDKAFVTNLIDSKHDKAIISAIISISNSLNIDVIAEGVESEEQKKYLEKMGCYRYQGYLYGKPMTPLHIEAMALFS